MQMTHFLAISLIIILAAISPGPDFAMVVKNSLFSGRKSGIMTAVGITVSLVVHSIYAILGLAVMIAHSLLLFNFIKYLGAAYIIYLGIKSILSRNNSMTINDTKEFQAITPYHSFMQGLLCNLLNPKAIMFILAFFTLAIDSSSTWFERVGFGVEIALVHLVWFTLLSLLITHSRVKQNLSKAQGYLSKVMGAVLIGFGTRICFLNQVI